MMHDAFSFEKQGCHSHEVVVDYNCHTSSTGVMKVAIKLSFLLPAPLVCVF